MRINGISLLLAVCVVGFLSLSGCLDITTTSQVNSNGSIVRTMTFTGDSAEVCRGKFPVELDSSWTKNITKVKGEHNNFTMTVSRTFQNVEEMNKTLKGTFGRTLQYRFELEKSFQWFFTVYRFREINLPFEQFTLIPMTEFLSQEEINWVRDKVLDKDNPKKTSTTRGDSLALESISTRMEEYARRNLFESVFTAFLEGVKTTNDPTLTAARIEPLKDSLYGSSKKAIRQTNIDTLSIIFARILRTSLVEKVWRASEQKFGEIERRIEFEHETNSHKYTTSVVMPGLITGSNATKIEGNTVTWRDFKDHAHYLGFTMWVESRQVNWWAVVAAFVVVAALVTLLIASLLRRRSRT